VQRQQAIFSYNLRTRARLPHEGQRKKLQPPPLGNRMCQRPTSRDTPAIVTRTRAISSLTSPKARSRATETEGQSFCVSLMAKQSLLKSHFAQRDPGTESLALKSAVALTARSCRKTHGAFLRQPG
jgi:hypothetical protein